MGPNTWTELVRDRAARRVFWATMWLAFAFVGFKAFHLGLPAGSAWADDREYLRSLAAISYLDVVFACGLWACGRTALGLGGNRPIAARLVSFAFLAAATLACVYALASVIMFGVFGGFLTFPLLALVGDVRMIRSSVAAYLTPGVVIGLLAVPLLYLALVEAAVRLRRPTPGLSWRHGVAVASLGAWIVFGQYAFAADWANFRGNQIAGNPHWVLMSSWWRAVSREGTVRMTDAFPPADLTDFDPIGVRTPSALPLLRRIAASTQATPVLSVRRPPNVILVVLESVGARWTSLNGTIYKTTPTLDSESAQAMVFDNFYAHIGRSSNSLAAILLSTYPKLGVREYTEEFADLPKTSLADTLRDRGYRTAFFTPSDLSWAGWRTFLERRGFDEISDYHALSCSDMLSSWGVEDRCMVDGMLQFINRQASRPFFMMAWTTQTHHPYEPSPGVPLLDLWQHREPISDNYDLGRYLNVLHETDHQLGRLFEAIRLAGLEQDTLVVITGDHGQAFGYPHGSYGQGRTVYEEDVHVPLMFWSPRLYQRAGRSKTIGSLVDLAPTIVNIAGVAPPSAWQGRSVFDAGHPPRAYFYVADDQFTLGIREDKWKYIFDLRGGLEELYDLNQDPNEQHNLASTQPEICARLRQRLAAWTEANRRQYGQPGT